MKMPAIFIGHGSPMNAIEHNQYTETWAKLGRRFKPKAILMISAHWFTEGVLTQNEEQPKKINDMYGFPEALYTLSYPVEGDAALTESLISILGDAVTISDGWGSDHGSWSVLVHMYPEHNIPVVQLSVNRRGTPREQYEIGKKISHLRDEGYMVIGSGNVVHNLGQIRWDMNGALPWAESFDDAIEDAIRNEAYEDVINYHQYGEPAYLSVPTPDHFFPLLSVLGAASPDDQLTVFNKGYEYGSLSMTGYLFE